MRLEDLDRRLRTLLSLDGLASADAAMNGLQVANLRGEVHRAAFAVDACLETIRRAASWKADLLFVHHGLFWGKPLAVTGGHYRRLAALLAADLALYAAHLPLDMHPELGNNAGLARLLGLSDLQPFGEYHGVKIGLKGRLPAAAALEQILASCCSAGGKPLQVLPFGPQSIRSVGIVSGGAADEVLQAIAEGLELFITGDASHTVYHHCLEAGINVIFAGHYLSEVWGVKLLAAKLAEEEDLATCFLDVPTGL